MPLRKIMRVFFIAMVAVAVLVSACLFSACISQKPDSQTTVLSPTPLLTTPAPASTPGSQSRYVSFEEAKENLGKYLDTNPQTNPDMVKSYIKTGENITILFIQGVDSDMTGNARLWAFGVRSDGLTQLRAYGRSGWTIVHLEENVSSGEIIPDRIVPPAALLEKNREILFGASPSGTERCDIELRDGIYSVTAGQTRKTMRFDAITGAPV